MLAHYEQLYNKGDCREEAIKFYNGGIKPSCNARLFFNGYKKYGNWIIADWRSPLQFEADILAEESSDNESASDEE